MTRTLLPALAFLLAGLALAGDAPEDQYQQRAAALRADDVDGHYRLALWCEENGLAAYALREHRAVVTLDPDHRASRRALGYEKVCGVWATGDELMRLKGFVEHDGEWLTPEEYALRARDAIADAKAKEARQVADRALKLAWNADEAVRARALGMIERLDASARLRPWSIATRIAFPDVRMRAVRGLGELNDAAALPPLYKRAIFDPDESIRQAAVKAIRDTDAEGKAGPFVTALQSPFDSVRVHAVKALGDLGDPSAVGPLVARYQVAGGSAQSVYISTMNQIAYVQDFDVEVAQTAFIADPVIGVIQDGLVLNFRALANSGYIDVYEKPALAASLSKLTGKDLGEDAKAWLDWYRNEEAAKRRRQHEDS